MLKGLFFSVLLVGFSSSLTAQKLVFENIGTKNGLPASEVYKLFQDKRGYVWVFTEYGIVKYNGSTFVPVCTNLPLAESAAYGIAESPSGNLYFINSKGKAYRIYRDKAYKIKGIEQATLEMEKTGTYPMDLFFNDKGTMIFSSLIKTYHFPSSSYTTDKLPKEKWKPYKEVSLYIERKRNPALDITFAGLTAPFNGGNVIQSDSKKNFEWINPALFKLNTARHTPVQYSGDRMYVACGYTVVYKQKGHPEKLLKFNQQILTLRKAPDGHIWIGLVDGLYEYDQELNFIEKHLNDIIVSNILFDNQCGVWIATIGRGVYHCRDINRKSYYNVVGSETNISMLKAINGKLFIGTYNGKLYMQESNGFREITSTGEKFSLNDVEYCNGRFYVAMNSGLNVCDKNIKSFSLVHAKFTATAYAIRKISETELLLVNGVSLGTYNCTTQKLKFELQPGHCREIIERNKGEYFILTNQGICCYRNRTFDFPTELKKFKGITLSRERLDAQKNLWFCAREKGVYRLDKNNRITHYTQLPSLITKDILFLSDGTVLLATNKGAFYTTVDAMNIKSSWKRLLDEEMSCLMEYGGSVLFGTRNGLIAIRKEHIRADRKRQFYLKNVKTGKKNVNFERGLNLNYNQNDLFFDFDVLDYQTQERVMMYQLNGPTKQNGTVLGTEVHLQNLDPGDYTLIVTPKVFDQENSKQQIVTHFRIHPAFWQTELFLIALVILAIALIFLISAVVIRRNHRKRTAKEKIEKLLTEYRITALKAQVNPHFMSNSLVAIQHLILESEIDRANLYIAKFSLLLRSLLDYSNKSAATLKDEMAMLELYVELEQLRFSNRFVFELEIDDDLNPNEILIPALITQPFVENAIWHGLLPLQDERNPKLTIRVTKTDDGILISIADNGVGRSEQKANTARDSKGTKLIMQRIESLNQLYQTTGGKIHFRDLKNEQGQAIGTVVEITLSNRMLKELEG